MTIAALYVATNGCYYGLGDVDPWDITRDARTYAGPHTVVAHPPCERWGRYWHGGPSARVRRVKGDDGGCFAAALSAVRKYGGVLEHPEASAAWAAFGIDAPPRAGGWIRVLDWSAWTCCVEQGHFGHRARKPTWLLYAGAGAPPSLPWGTCGPKARIDVGFHSAAERAAFRANRSLSPEMAKRKSAALDEWERKSGMKDFRRLTKTERTATPIPFRDMLLAIARSATLPDGQEQRR